MTIPGKQLSLVRVFHIACLSLLTWSQLACSNEEQAAAEPRRTDKPRPDPVQAEEEEEEEAEPEPRSTLLDAALAPKPVEKDKERMLDAGSAADAAPVVDECSGSSARWVAIAEANCVACHGPRSAAAGGFAAVLDVSKLIASGKVVPGSPETSPLFLKVSSGAMPPPARMQRPSADDVEAMRKWISCGAQAYERPLCQGDCTTFVDIATRLNLMVDDLKPLDTPEKRSDVRYLDLTNYANAGHSEQTLELYRDGLSYLMNSLSRSAKIVVPQAVDSQALVFRIRLSDYGWTPQTWEQLVASYPYDVSYDPNSRTFPINDTQLTKLREQTGTLTPYVQGDWFFSHASRAPLYYELLGIPATVGELEAQLRIDIVDDIRNQRVARSGFKESGPSRYNRIIERHELSEGRGILWLTFDFDSGSGTSNVITHPLDFRQTSSEILFTLPNGLYGYMIIDSRGARLAKAPNASVQDTKSSDLAIESATSCLNCHVQTGVIGQPDEVREAATLTASNAAVTDTILALYPEQATLTALFDGDRLRYQTALGTTRMRAFGDGSTHTLDEAFSNLLSSKDVAGVLGIEEQRLLALINASPTLFPPEMLALRTPGAKLPRDLFDSLFPQLVVGLGLGVP